MRRLNPKDKNGLDVMLRACIQRVAERAHKIIAATDPSRGALINCLAQIEIQPEEVQP
jgi:hypothetical protein